MSSNVFHVFPLLPPSMRKIRLGGFGLLDVLRIGHFGLVFDLAYQTCNNCCMYVFSLEYLLPFLSYRVSTYDIITSVN